MMGEYAIWLVIKNKEDEKRAEKVKQLAEEIAQKENVSYKKLLIRYSELQPFMDFTYLQIGKVNGKKYDIISGIKEIHGLQYKVEGFEPKVAIDMQYFIPFFKKLTENIELKDDTLIEIYYGKDLPVWFTVYKIVRQFEVQKLIGVIAPKIFEPTN